MSDKLSKTKNPIFYYKNIDDFEIKAGGVIFYTFDKDECILKFLLINNNGIYEDFGGKTDLCDKSIFDTITREVEEESNKIFTRKEIFDKIKNKNPLYTKNSKYILYFCHIKDHEQYKSSMFGDREFHENIERTVEWISYNTLKTYDFINNNLNFRLKSKNFFKRIKYINNYYDKKYKKKKPTVNVENI